MVCATVTLILFYVNFFECVAGFVVNFVMFPTCLVFLTAKLVWTLLVLDLTRVLVLSVRHKERAVEKVLCQSQTW